MNFKKVIAEMNKYFLVRIVVALELFFIVYFFLFGYMALVFLYLVLLMITLIYQDKLIKEMLK